MRFVLNLFLSVENSINFVQTGDKHAEEEEEKEEEKEGEKDKKRKRGSRRRRSRRRSFFTLDLLRFHWTQGTKVMLVSTWMQLVLPS